MFTKFSAGIQVIKQLLLKRQSFHLIRSLRKETKLNNW